MQELSLYTFGNRDYYERPGQVAIAPAYRDAARALLPMDWELTRSDIWLYAARPGTTLPVQGFKIHLACSPDDAQTMIERLVPACVRADTTFKIVADPMMHRLMNSKRYGRGGAGKFAAVYPPDHERFMALVEELRVATAGMRGPYILSDRRYRDSEVVFYRYGAFRRIERINLEGARIPLMKAPDGSLVPDQRLPYFNLPDGIEDPFPPEPEGEDGGELLNGRYRVEEAITFSNTGGIYRAVDTRTGAPVIVKEARPNTLTWVSAHSAVEACAALRHEYDCLRRLEGLECVPPAIELFQEWEHLFLVVSYFDGLTLTKYRAQADFLVMAAMHDPDAVRAFCTQWRAICLRLLDAIDAVHVRGVIIGDISPGNVMIAPETGELALIDIEGASIVEDGKSVTRFGTQWFNPGFRRAESRTATALTTSDDIYACGILLYSLVCPTQALSELDPTYPLLEILDHFVEAGLPPEVRQIVQHLIDGRSGAARAAALAWRP